MADFGVVYQMNPDANDLVTDFILFLTPTNPSI